MHISILRGRGYTAMLITICIIAEWSSMAQVVRKRRVSNGLTKPFDPHISLVGPIQVLQDVTLEQKASIEQSCPRPTITGTLVHMPKTFALWSAPNDTKYLVKLFDGRRINITRYRVSVYKHIGRVLGYNPDNMRLSENSENMVVWYKHGTRQCYEPVLSIPKHSFGHGVWQPHVTMAISTYDRNAGMDDSHFLRNFLSHKPNVDVGRFHNLDLSSADIKPSVRVTK